MEGGSLVEATMRKYASLIVQIFSWVEDEMGMALTKRRIVELVKL